MPNEMEYRDCAVEDCGLVVTAEEREDGDSPVIEGYAAVFDKWSVDMWGWKEKIARGAFGENLGTNPDVRALIDHNSSMMLGRTTAGTLTLEEDKRGLKVHITPQDTTVANDLILNMRAGNINQMSFAFQMVEEQWNEKFTQRTITKADLFDVSVVTYPAYKQAKVKVRSALACAGIDPYTLAGIFERAKLSIPIDDEDMVVARALMTKLAAITYPYRSRDQETRKKIAKFLFDNLRDA